MVREFPRKAGKIMVIALALIGALVVMAGIYTAVVSVGTRLTGKQIKEDPEVRKDVAPDQRDQKFPLDADF
jgi:hypothetical protein